MSESEAGVTVALQMLDRVKREERWKQGIGAFALVVAAVGVVWLGPTKALVIAGLLLACVWLLPARARSVLGSSYVLRDRHGTIRYAAVLSEVDSPQVFLCDPSGIPRALLALDPDGWPALTLMDDNRHTRLGIAVTPAAAALAQADANDKTRIFLATESNGGRPTLELRGDEVGTSTLLLPAAADFLGESEIRLHSLGPEAMLVVGHGDTRVTNESTSKGAVVFANHADNKIGLVSTDEDIALVTQSHGSTQALSGDDLAGISSSATASEPTAGPSA